jgi:hypothetical protein
MAWRRLGQYRPRRPVDALRAVAALPLGGLFALVFFGARRDGWGRLSLAVVLGGVPLFFVIKMVGEQHGLWPRM